MSLKSLIAANPQIANPQRIYPGDTITVPGGMGGAAPARAGGSAQAAPGGAQPPASMRLSQDGRAIELEAARDDRLAEGVIRVSAAHPATAALARQFGAIEVERVQ